MKTNEILAAVTDRKGQAIRVCFKSHVPTLKGVNKEVIKTSRMVCVSGINLANRKEIKEAIAANERGELGPLPWGHWKQFPFVIEHTPKGATEAVEYFRFYPLSEAQQVTFNLYPEVKFTADGVEITRDEAIALCGSKAKATEEIALCFSPRVSTVESVGIAAE